MPTNTRGPVWRPTGSLRIIVVVAIAIAMAYFAWQKQQQQPRPNEPPPPAAKPASSNGGDTAPALAPESAPTAAQPVALAKTTIRDQKIFNQLGDEVFRGDIDVRPTLERIRNGKRLQFPNDGSVFQNRERRLKEQPASYYREYVHPTPGLSGPGPQRIVMGKGGEAYYTPDHYRTFRRVDEP